MSATITHRVLVLGAGYAGLTAATRLARQVDTEYVTITLVNAVDEFVQRPRLHQAATGQALPALPLSRMLGNHGIELLIGWVHAIDPDTKTDSTSTTTRRSRSACACGRVV